MARQRLTENQLETLSKLGSDINILVVGDGRVLLDVGRGVVGLDEKYSRTLESLHKRGFVNVKIIYGGTKVYEITNSGTKAYKEASKN